MSMLITQKLHWDENVAIIPDARVELDFWFQNIYALSPRVIAPWFRKPERIIYTDASDYAGAGVLLDSVTQTFHCMWDEWTQSQSSTFRELKAVNLVLNTFEEKLKNKFVKLYSDNQNVVRIAKTGSLKPLLQTLAFSIYKNCLEHNRVIYSLGKSRV